MRKALGILVFALLLAADIATAGELSIRQFQLPGHGALLIAVPDAWRVEVGQAPAGSPPTLKFTAKSGPAFELLVTPVWSIGGKPLALDSATIHQEVESMTSAVQPHAAERAIAIKPLKGSSGVGYYFSATNRLTNPGEFKHLARGIVPVGNMLVTFTILTNDGADATVNAALLLLQTISQKKAGAA